MKLNTLSKLERNGLMKINDLIKEKSKNPEFKKGLDLERGKLEAAIALYNARTDAGLTQSELSQLAGTSQKTIANIEHGENVTFNKFFSIMSALGRTVEIKVR